MTPSPNRILSALVGLILGLGLAGTSLAADKGSEGTSGASGKDEAVSQASNADSAQPGDDEHLGPKNHRHHGRGARGKVKARVDAGSLPSRSKTSAAILVGYGASEATRLGLGARVGLHLEQGPYVGATAQYFLGSTSSNTQLGTESSYSRKLIVAGIEGGVDLPATPLIVVSPYLGLGMGFAPVQHCNNGDCTAETEFRMLLDPGLAASYALGPTAFLGADLRYLVVMASTNTSGVVASLAAGLIL